MASPIAPKKSAPVIRLSVVPDNRFDFDIVAEEVKRLVADPLHYKVLVLGTSRKTGEGTRLFFSLYLRSLLPGMWLDCLTYESQTVPPSSGETNWRHQDLSGKEGQKSHVLISDEYYLYHQRKNFGGDVHLVVMVDFDLVDMLGYGEHVVKTLGKRVIGEKTITLVYREQHAALVSELHERLLVADW